MNDDPLTIWLGKVILALAAVLIVAFVLIWATGCYRPVIHIHAYEVHTHTSPPVNPGGLNSNEIRGGDALERFYDGITEEMATGKEDDDRVDSGRTRGDGATPASPSR